MKRISFKSIEWPNCLFLAGTLGLTLSVLPVYLWREGLDLFQVILFFFFFVASGLSITLGYHRLFSHRAFKAAWPVRLVTLIFGAAAFENSALCWAADHRRHHKFSDHEGDPYNINKGFFYAHIGWILLKDTANLPTEFVQDLQQDRLVQWQHRHYRKIAVLAGLGLPTLIGLLWGGWNCALGSLLIAGVGRLVLVQHFTFLINSLCHSIGRQPYSSKGSARDSALMAFFTFGEGYHNFHHTFQHDYRNGIRPWQFDPTKWSIWLLHKCGLARQLRRVPRERILQCEIAEQQRQLAARLNNGVRLSEPILSRLQTVQLRVEQAYRHWEQREAEYCRAAERRLEASREKIAELRRDFREATIRFRAAIREWQETHRLIQAHLA